MEICSFSPCICVGVRKDWTTWFGRGDVVLVQSWGFMRWASYCFHSFAILRFWVERSRLCFWRDHSCGQRYPSQELGTKVPEMWVRPLVFLQPATTWMNETSWPNTDDSTQQDKSSVWALLEFLNHRIMINKLIARVVCCTVLLKERRLTISN